MRLVAIVLAANEAKHLPRCLGSLKGVASLIVVVDCYSSDDTVSIARAHDATVFQHEWRNYATQFNWALDQIPNDVDWVLRIDADEYLTPHLAAEIRERLPHVKSAVHGVFCGRRMQFQGEPIRYGGLFPIRVLRLFRYGRGRCENRWMDEHIKVSGATVDFGGDLIDDNLNTLTWWTDKHNRYASREAVDLLNLKYGFMPLDSVASVSNGSQASLKRWIKERMYARLPLGLRAFAYFFYRYVIRLGFIDSETATTFHVLQGFWYRYLVDAKVVEVERYMAKHGCDVVEAIAEVLDIQPVLA